jgi:hypothetical protein
VWIDWIIRSFPSPFTLLVISLRLPVVQL